MVPGDKSYRNMSSVVVIINSAECIDAEFCVTAFILISYININKHFVISLNDLN